jgi:hypothetical protein
MAQNLSEYWIIIGNNEFQVIAPNTEAAILACVIEADQSELTPDVSKYLLSMQPPHADSARVDELPSGARSGSLTEAAASGLDSNLHIG